jgi:ribosomal protein L37AE/L43A
MKRMMLLKENQITFSCPVCDKDKFHRYTQMFYDIHWCESCENYFTIDKKSGKRYVFLLNENESKPVRTTKPSKLKPKTKDLKYILEKRNRKTQNKKLNK